jgi:Mg2+/Co2+ transporter CorB
MAFKKKQTGLAVRAGKKQKLDKAVEEIEIVINEDGSVTGDVLVGPGGQGCLDLLEELLGDFDSDGSDPDKKDEFFATVGGKSSVTVGK